MIDHPTFKIDMPADSVVFIVNHTRRDYIHANKIIGVEDDGIIIQWYLQDATLTMARREGMYRIIDIGRQKTKEEYDSIEQVDPQTYLNKHYADGFNDLVKNVKNDRKKIS